MAKKGNKKSQKKSSKNIKQKVKKAGVKKTISKAKKKASSPKKVKKKIVKPAKVVKKIKKKTQSAKKNKPSKVKKVKTTKKKVKPVTTKKTIRKKVSKAVKKLVKVTKPAKPVKPIKPVKQKNGVTKKKELKHKAISQSIKKEKAKENIAVKELPKADKSTYTAPPPPPKKKEITYKEFLKETEESKTLPTIFKTLTIFSDSLTDDNSSVFSKTAEGVEPPGKFYVEFRFNISPELIYKYLTEPNELAEWFCDEVNIRNGIYTFVWNGAPQQARLVRHERNSMVRFQWIDKTDGSYFEYKIDRNFLTGDVSLHITDFSEPFEIEKNKLWWANQISKLKNLLGAH